MASDLNPDNHKNCGLKEEEEVVERKVTESKKGGKGMKKVIDIEKEWENFMDLSIYWKTFSDGYTWHE